MTTIDDIVSFLFLIGLVVFVIVSCVRLYKNMKRKDVPYLSLAVLAIVVIFGMYAFNTLTYCRKQGCLFGMAITTYSAVIVAVHILVAILAPAWKKKWPLVLGTIFISVIVALVFDTIFITGREGYRGEKGPNVHDVYPEWRIID